MLCTRFPGETIFILGGGPTLTAAIAERVRGRRTIVLNSTARLAPWADVLFFCDWHWFREHRPIVDPWPAAVVTISARAARVLPHKIELVTPPIVQAKPLSAGHHAVDLALAMGACRIVLLGFDCRLVDGRSHNHGDYGHNSETLYAEKFVPAWTEYPARAAARQVSVLNATPGSALDVFPKATLDEVLST